MTDRFARLSMPTAVLIVAALALTSAHAITGRRDSSRFDDRIKTREGGVIAVTPRALGELDATDGLRRAWEGFVTEQNGGWKVWVDERSGLATLAVGRGIPWIPGRGNGLASPVDAGIEDLEARARQFFQQQAHLLGRWPDQLVLDTEGSRRLGENGWQLRFRQQVGGVPVEGARYDFQLSHGNLVSFGATRWAPVLNSPMPSLSATDARAVLDQYLDVDTATVMTELQPAELVFVPVDPRGLDAESWHGARGRGIEHRLIWRFRMNEPGHPATWVAEIDAHGGQVVAFYDDTRYEQVQGGVYPITNTNKAGDPSTIEQAFFPMPFADYSEDGGPDQQTGDFGLYECINFGSTIETNLDGPYVRINDNCGAISETTTCDNELDLGTSAGDDCAVPAGASPGNTHSARTQFYHLNRIKQTARFWLPSNTWLQGKLTANVNINNTCNAFWNGTVNFYRSGGGCGNTGEIAAVSIHEWGHGMDQNDGGGYDNPSEAYADVVAILQSRESCVGRGFFIDGSTCSGYGDSCLTCTGIREMDWDARQAHTPATPANFTQPNCGGGGGPCGREVHCESYVPSESMYDLAARDLPAMGVDADTAWQHTERLFYTSRAGSGGNVINCSLPNADSCNTGSWFNTLRVADDDDGDLSNGTPHAEAIFAAFDRHGIACGQGNDPENTNSSSCPTLQTPVVTTRELTNSVELSWDADPNAASYYVMRNELDCNRSYTPIGQPAATSFTDDELANDFQVYYRVQAVGANPSCVGPVSACITATPQALAGNVRFLASTFGCSNVIQLRVKDANVGSSTVTIDVWSDSEPTPESVVLTETAPGTGKFIGSIMSTSAPAANGDGLLSIVDGDTMTARYVDADDGAGGTNVVQQHTALADCVFPLVSDVHEENIGLSSATIVWTTDELSDTVVNWDELTPPANSQTGDPRTTNHRVTLSGLAQCTTYFYEVESTDPAGNTALDDSGGNYYRFETLGNFGSGAQPCHAGQVTIGGNVYSCSDSVGFQVVDLDLNLDPQIADTVVLTATSSSETIAETVIATETGPNTSVFTGTIATAAGAPVAGDGLLQVADGDTITVTYRDLDDGTGLPAISFDTSSADCSGPAITNLRVDTLTNARGTIRWNTPENADTVVEWGATPALGQVSSSGSLTTVHATTINQFDTCTTFYFRVSSTDVHGNTTVVDDNGQPFSLHTWGIPGLYYHENFESGAPGWTLGGEWEVGPPQGIGGSSGTPDPAGAYNNVGVLGHDLSGQGVYPGDYEPGTVEIADSPDLDGTSWQNSTLIYYRRLNAGSGDAASLNVFVDGVGRPVFNTLGGTNFESSFQTISVPISQLGADGAGSVRLEFKQVANSSGEYSGWNVDDVIIKDGSLPDYAACSDCGAAPSFAGAVSASDNDACGASGVTVSWNQAVNWGSAGGGSYALYRDTVPGFTPGPANLVMSGITALSYDDLSAPTDAQLYYIVRAEGDESGCGLGPNNGGLLDDNLVAIPVGETTSQPLPGAVANAHADLINKAHLRLAWDAVSGASGYRIFRSTSPQAGTFVLLAETSSTSYEDLNQGGNGNSYYYLVRAINGCGQEGP